AAAAVERCRDIQVALNVHRQSLRAAQATVENADVAMRVDLMDGVEARRCGTRNIEVAAVAERQMIGRNARFQHGEDEDLTVAPDFEDGSTAIPNVKITFVVKGDAGRDAHALCVRGHGAVWRHTVHRSVVPRGNIEVAGSVEG